MAGGVGRFRVQDYFIRFLFIYALIVATYNPTGYSYVHWLVDAESGYFAVKFVVGLSLLLAHRYIASIAWRAMLRRGVGLTFLFFATAMWALDSQGLLPVDETALILLVEAFVAAGLAMGMSLVLLWQHVSGQVTATIEVH